MDLYSRIQAIVSLDAVLHNLEAMKQNFQEGSRLIAVVKADGYGHGAVPIARVAEALDYLWGFATATWDEAKELRMAGIQKPILILGYTFPEDYHELVEADVRPTVFRLDMALELEAAAAAAGKVLHIHLALDTGMSRIGFSDSEESIVAIEKIAALPHLCIEGLFTHFARADETDIEPARGQFACYQAFVNKLEEMGIHLPIKHCSNSAGILRMPEAHLDAVRAGIILYGIYPSDEVEREGIALEPAMELKSHIVHLKTVPAHTPVSYGGTFVTEKETVIATIPVGYADGYCRGLSGKGWVLIHGQKAPILGRICMDQFMVDVSAIKEAAIGDTVTLLGKDQGEYLSVDELGALSGRFPYEFVCQISKRVPRVYQLNGKEVTF